LASLTVANSSSGSSSWPKKTKTFLSTLATRSPQGKSCQAQGSERREVAEPRLDVGHR
jgi:hypothetical protein